MEKLKWYSGKNKEFFINVKSIKSATINDINPLYIKFFDVSDKIQTVIKESLFQFLKVIDRLYLKETIYTLIKESAVNAFKANIKRTMFASKRLDINSHRDYEESIKYFKQDMLDNIDEYIKLSKKDNRYVMLRILYKNKILYIDIKNNCPINKQELDRVNYRIEKSKELESMADLFTIGFDNTEGAGLGIGMTSLLLKNEGFEVDNFTIKSDGKSTVASFKLPIELKQEHTGYKIAKEMISEIDELPTFDDNVNKIQQLIRSEGANINDISEVVQQDISLTSSLLKLANSAAFSVSHKVEDVNKAIQLIGLKELDKILYSVGTKRIMENRYAAFEEVWETSNECAFICNLLAKRKKLNKQQQNNLSVAGLLHDIGRVILLTIDEGTVKSVVKLSGMRDEPADLMLEEAVIGVSHTTIGVMICKKWNFPKSIQDVVEYHHNPYMVNDEENKLIVYTVYLADRIVEFNQGVENFEKIFQPAIAMYGFNKTDFIKFAVDSKKEYIRHSYQK